MRYGTNLPPEPKDEPHAPQPSFLMHVWREGKLDDLGTATTTETGHLVSFHLGADKSEIIELRAVDEAFYPGHQRPEATDPQPTFLAYVAGTEDRAGTVWPHDDGKGHRLKLRHSLSDGAAIELRTTGHYVTADEFRLLQQRRPKHRPRFNA